MGDVIVVYCYFLLAQSTPFFSESHFSQQTFKNVLQIQITAMLMPIVATRKARSTAHVRLAILETESRVSVIRVTGPKLEA